MTEITGSFDNLGFLKLPRKIEVVESRYEKTGKSALVNITELGIA